VSHQLFGGECANQWGDIGQAESGKSTLQKQFQLLYAPRSLEEERASWRSVVYLNIVKSVRTILEALDLDTDDAGYMSDRTTNGTSVRRSEKHELWQQQLANLKLRLQPFLSLEDQLTDRLSGTTAVTSNGTPLVRSGWQFNLKLARRALRHSRSSRDDPSASRTTLSSLSSESGGDGGDPNARMLQASAEDITELWHHPSVRAMLRRRRVLKLEDSAELYVVLLLLRSLFFSSFFFLGFAWLILPTASWTISTASPRRVCLPVSNHGRRSGTNSAVYHVHCTAYLPSIGAHSAASLAPRRYDQY
jgi:G-protein alpha subunit